MIIKLYRGVAGPAYLSLYVNDDVYVLGNVVSGKFHAVTSRLTVRQRCCPGKKLVLEGQHNNGYWVVLEIDRMGISPSDYYLEVMLTEIHTLCFPCINFENYRGMYSDSGVDLPGL